MSTLQPYCTQNKINLNEITVLAVQSCYSIFEQIKLRNKIKSRVLKMSNLSNRIFFWFWHRKYLNNFKRKMCKKGTLYDSPKTFNISNQSKILLKMFQQDWHAYKKDNASGISFFSSLQNPPYINNSLCYKQSAYSYSSLNFSSQKNG